MKRSLIYSTKGRFFSVEFTKKNGENRKMIARIGVRKHLRGGELGYDPQSKGLVVAWDATKHDYRCINLRTVKSFHCGSLVFIKKKS